MPRKPAEVTTPQSGPVELFRQQFERWRRGFVLAFEQLEEDFGNLDTVDNSSLLVRREGADIGTRPAINLHEGTGITLTVTDDAVNDEVDITINSSVSAYTDEQAQDAVGGALVDSASVDFTYNDGANTITAVVLPAGVDAASLSGFTEAAQDAVGAALTDTTSIDLTYNDGANTISAAIIDEYVQDVVGAMCTDSSRIDFTYNDGAGTVTADLIADSVTFTYLQNVTGPTLVGRESGVGDMAQIGVSTGLLITGGDLEIALTAGHGIDVTGATIDVDETEFTTGPGLITPAMLNNGGARSLLGRSANSAGARADISGSGTSTSRQVPIDDGTSVAWGRLTFADIDEYVVRDFDLTTESTNDWNAGGDGNYSMGGLTWAIVGTGVADTLGLVNGTGLRFNASGGTSSVMTNASQTATYLRILCSTLIPSFLPWATYLFEIYASSITLGTSGDAIKFGIWQDTAGTDRLMAGGRRNTSGTQQTFTANDASENGFAYTHTNFALKISDLGATTYSGTYSSGFVYTAGGGHFSATDSAPALFDPTAAYFFISYPSNTAGNADSTIARLRIRRVG